MNAILWSLGWSLLPLAALAVVVYLGRPVRKSSMPPGSEQRAFRWGRKTMWYNGHCVLAGPLYWSKGQAFASGWIHVGLLMVSLALAGCTLPSGRDYPDSCLPHCISPFPLDNNYDRAADVDGDNCP